MNSLLKICLVVVVFSLVLNGLSCSEKPLEQLPSNNSLIDATGNAISITNLPGRIISLAPSLTENVYLLGCGEQLVGVTVYCEYPEPAKSKAKIGTVLEPNIEKIIILKPDLVLATKEGNKPEVVKELRNLGIRVFVFGEKKSFSDILLSFNQLAGLLDREEIARKILNDTNHRLKAVQERIGQLPRKKVFIQLSVNPLMTVAQDTFIDEIISLAGGSNIAHDCQMRYPIYSLEAIVVQDPEVIVITEMGIATIEAKEAWTKFPNISAVKARKIFVLDTKQSHYFCEPTPLGFAQSVEEIARLLYPE